MATKQEQQYGELELTDVPEGIPEGLYVSLLTYIEDASWMPPQGTPGLRAMVKIGGSAMPADFEWIEEQEGLQAEASRILARVHEVAPMPTTEQLMVGDSAKYPDWVGEVWVQTLMLPWSQDLAEAVTAGRAYVESKASA